MKIFITCFLFSLQIFSQTYLNILFNEGYWKNARIIEISKMTFSTSGEQINFHLTNGMTKIENIGEIRKMVFGNIPEGEPLPVELILFNATANSGSVTLKWITSTEIDNYGFEIERTCISTTQEWKKIGFVQGSGNSNSPKEYMFKDNPQGGTKYQYRLKQIDTDGKYRYSSIINVEVGIPSQYDLKQNMPNPFNPTTIISYSLPKDGLVSLIVDDIIGREVASLVSEYQKAGSYSVTFDGSELSSGVYICKIQSTEYCSSIKMLLMK